MSTPSIVLVHGSFMSEWCWIPVVDRLERAGLKCHTVELPFTSMDDDISMVRAAIEHARSAGPVTAVCHSYSGITLSMAGHGADHLVYVAARLPEIGESPRTRTGTWGTPEFQAAMTLDDGGWHHLDDSASDLFFNRSPRSLARMAMAHRRPMRSWVPDTPIERPAWLEVPTSYVVCSDDLTVRVDQQRFCATRVHDSIEIVADHSPFFSAPDRLAEFMLDRHATGVRR